MRNLEDCKAEVFRRSEERIKERKRKRNCVLACCIPLCLLLVAGGLYIRPLLEPVDESMKSGGTNQIPDRVLGGLESVLYGDAGEYTCVKITDRTGETEMFRYSTDKEIVGGLGRFVAAIFTLSETKETYPADGSENDGIVVPEMSTAGQDWDTIREELEEKYGLDEPPADYKLVFRKATGEEAVFRLHENHLYNEENGCVVKLSDAMSAELKKRIEKALEAGTDK